MKKIYRFTVFTVLHELDYCIQHVRAGHVTMRRGCVTVGLCAPKYLCLYIIKIFIACGVTWNRCQFRRHSKLHLFNLRWRSCGIRTAGWNLQKDRRRVWNYRVRICLKASLLHLNRSCLHCFASTLFTRSKFIIILSQMPFWK